MAHQAYKHSIQAYRSTNMIFVYLVLSISFNMLDVQAATHIVGDNDGWSLLTGSSNWTQGKEFRVGDVLVFNYDSQSHNVMQVDSSAYDYCMKDSYIELFSSGSDLLVLSEVGQFWYICGVDDHCENGQKLSINVVD